MPPRPPELLLISTTRSTFESLALLFAEPLSGEPLGNNLLRSSPFGDDAVSACVAFAGTAHGEAADGALAVTVTADVATALAENMLGVDAASPTERRDAVGEFANVVCGHVLSAAGGPDAVFSLVAPACRDGVPAGEAPRALGASVWRAWLDVEGGRACVTLHAPPALFAAAGVHVPAGAPA